MSTEGWFFGVTEKGRAGGDLEDAEVFEGAAPDVEVAHGLEPLGLRLLQDQLFREESHRPLLGRWKCC